MDKNYNERMRLFKDAKSIDVTDKQITEAVECIWDKIRRRGNDVPIIIKKNNESHLVCWVAKWGKYFDVTVMGYRFNYVTDDINNIAKWCCQLAIAEKKNDYHFIYGN